MAKNKNTLAVTKKSENAKSTNLVKGSKTIPKDYRAFLEDLKARIRSSQLKAAISVNQELIKLYWEIGSSLYQRQQQEGWGAKTIVNLVKDLKDGFPGIKGFSLTNIKYMVQFAKEYPDFLISQQVVGQIPWGHNLLLLHRLENLEARLWYAAKTIENGWSRNVLWHWVDTKLFTRQGKAITNFTNTLPTPQSDLAHQTLKDPYCFDFLTIREEHDENELEEGLVNHVQRFLIELGKGFAFVGRQYPLTVSGQAYFIDLLFYHLQLRCYFVIELKAKAFKPGDAGQMNFYLSAVDDLLRHPEDKPTIGLLLCKTKDSVVAEYALRNINSPIGIAEYEIAMVESLPKDLKSSLPTIKEIEAELKDRP